MSDVQDEESRLSRRLLVGAGILAAGIVGAFLSRVAFSPPNSPSAPPSRPIVQIVRQQPGLADLSDVVDRLCPSVALIVPRDAASTDAPHVAAAFSVSADGWVVASAASLPQGQLDAIFGDGQRSALSEVRTDPVSGIAVIKAEPPIKPPLTFSDQIWARVGQFGFAMSTPVGNGCSANSAMIESDFLADGGKVLGYIRIRSDADIWASGLPFLGADGRVLGIAASDPVGAIIPAPIAAVAIDELIRNELAPSTYFGFRAIDYGAPFTARLGGTRSGAGIALVQAKSTAARAGLQAGDVVTAVNDEPVSSASELNRALDAELAAATLTIQRGSNPLKVTIRRAS